MQSPDSRYRILSTIGRGGMGTVYLAEDTALRRKVALKFLSSVDLADAAAHRRLLREAQAAATLDHPFICKVYEVGERDGQPFIAMEYLEGTSLRMRLNAGPLPTAEALRLGAEIAEALECAQTHAIVHRDLKPANVMLTSDGHVKVMDFGLAQHIAADATTETLTLTDKVTGTLAYMSPEQLRGEPVDSRSDIFAFGIVLQEMLTGSHPFGRASAVATAEAILTQAPAPLTSALPQAPALLQHLMERLLSREKGERVQTFRDVHNELRLAAGTASAAGAAGATGAPRRQRATTHRRRNRLVLSVGLVAIAVLVLWKYPAWFNRPALAFNQRDWIVVADVQNLTGDPVFDRSLSLALTMSIAQSQYVNVLPQSRVRDALQRMQRSAGDTLDEGLACELALRERAKAVLGCSIAQVGNVYSVTARLIDPASRVAVITESMRVQRKDDVLPALDHLGSQVRHRLGESLEALSRRQLPLARATTASLEALQLYSDGRRATDVLVARQLLEAALKLDPEFAMAHAQLGALYYRESDQAMRRVGDGHLTQALALVNRLSMRERLLIAALAEDSRGNRNGAVLAYRAYLEAYPDDSDVWFRLGWTYMAGLRAFQPAVDAFQRALALDPNNVSDLINLATSYRGLSRDGEARDAYERAFAIEPAWKLAIYVNHEYGFTLVRLGELDRAAALFEQMSAASDPPRRCKGNRSLGLLAMYRGRYREAAGLLRQAIKLNHDAKYGVSELRDRVYLALSLRALGRSRELEAELDRIEAVTESLDLAPEWLRVVVKLLAREGRERQAEALLAAKAKNIGVPTSDSSANRNMADDIANVEVARGELDLAAGRAEPAIARFQSAHDAQPTNNDTLESLATACLAAGRTEDAARHFEQLIAARPLGADEQEYWLRAHLRLAEIRQQQRDSAGSRSLYEALLAIWKDADPDLPALQQVRKQLAKLP